MVEYVKILNYVQSKDFWEFDLDKCDSIIFYHYIICLQLICCSSFVKSFYGYYSFHLLHVTLIRLFTFNLHFHET